MWSLRLFLSAAHVRGLKSSWLLDRNIDDPLLEERLLHIRAQMTAALVLHSALAEMGVQGLPDTVDLQPLIAAGMDAGIINDVEVGILTALNRRANEAKHLLYFRSRM